MERVVAFFIVCFLCCVGLGHGQPCASQPCQNGGSCYGLENGFLCVCVSGFGGLTCQQFQDTQQCAATTCPAESACRTSHNSIPTTLMDRLPVTYPNGGGTLDHRFGYDIEMSADGLMLVVGAPYYTYQGGPSCCGGGAFVYARPTVHAPFVQAQFLLGTGYVGQSSMGTCVSISADGKWIILGGTNDNSNIGAVWVFANTTNGYFEQQGTKLVPSDHAGSLSFVGNYCALSGDGYTIGVGGVVDNNNAGSAWAFVRNPGTGTWSQQGTKLVGSGATATALQGCALVLSYDGNIMVVGAQADNGNVGSMFIWKRAGTTWTQTQYIASPFTAGRGFTGSGKFGLGLDMSQDGRYIVAGAQNVIAIPPTGRVAIYNTSDFTTWSELQEIVGTPNTGNFGYAVCISADARSIAVGAPAIASDRRGGVFLYKRSSSTGLFIQSAGIVQPTDSNGNLVLDQGFATQLSATGDALVISAISEASAAGGTEGKVYYYSTNYTTQCVDQFDSCTSLPCQNGGTCTDNIGYFFCRCAAGYSGTQCQTQIDYCTSSPCRNGGTCVGAVNSYFCSCVAGYSGRLCTTDINECSSGPCANGGTCVDQLNSYFCSCAIGYSGAQCNTNINECSSGPCANGGTCVDQLNSYFCSCAIGYSGLVCQTHIDECASRPCQNGGSCYGLEQGFLCVCASGFGGLTCQQFQDTQQCAAITCPAETACRTTQNAIPSKMIDRLPVTYPNGGGTLDYRFGYDLDVSSDGLMLIVGVPYYTYEDSIVQGGGGAFVYTRSAVYEQFVQAQFLHGTGYSGVSYQGTCVSISADGKWAILGGTTDASSIGAVWVFANTTNGYFTQQGSKLVPSDYNNAGGASYVGNYCSLSGDGYTLAVGGVMDNTNTGAAWAFVRDPSSGTWSQQGTKLVSSSSTATSMQGQTIVLSYDGNIMVVGAQNDNSGKGAIIIWKRSNAIWTQVQFISSPFTNARGFTFPGKFGMSADMSQDGRYIVVGAQRVQNSVGRVAIYTTANFTAWDIKQEMSCPTGGNIPNYGYSVRISGDAQTISVGAPDIVNVRKGGVFVYKRSNVTGFFVQSAGVLRPTDESGNLVLDMGFATTLSANGNALIISAISEGGAVGGTEGKVYYYRSNYTAQCVDQYDSCASQPCRNGGTCVDNSGYFFCRCAAGYSGLICQTQIDYCASAPCANGGTCFTAFNSYFCSCVSGYSGLTCQADVNECASTPCMNGGTCVDQNNGFVCSCLAGYSGRVCQTDINECASSPCQQGSTCHDQVNSFMCHCVHLTAGVLCQYNVTYCDDTILDQCNFGTCVNDTVNPLNVTNGQGLYYCVCNTGYEGMHCQHITNHCVSGPCQNGGQCNVLVNGYSCSCASGYSGSMCQTNVDECTSIPCTNGGTCVDQTNSYFCTCPAGYSGAVCQTEINECSSVPCANGGTCVDQLNSHFCTCASGYSGSHCQTDIDECASQPCINGGTCIDGLGAYTCECTSAFYGTNCEQLSLCASQPCSVDETCIPSTAGYYCHAAVCSSQPCQNGGTCLPTEYGYACVCVTGYTGRTCQTYADAQLCTAYQCPAETNNCTTTHGVLPIVQQSRLPIAYPNGAQVGQYLFGAELAQSADGLILVVSSAYYPDASGNLYDGGAFVYTRPNLLSEFTQAQFINGSGEIGHAGKGGCIAISADGSTILMTGIGDNGSKGAAWIFTNTTGVFTQQGPKLVPSDVSGNPSSGFYCAISGDGYTFAIGGTQDQTNIGATWVFVRDVLTNTWSQQGLKLIGTPVAAPSVEGNGMSLSFDGSVLAIGAVTYPSGTNYGAVWIFKRNSTNVWSQTQFIQSPFTAAQGYSSGFFGGTIAMSYDSKYIAIGAVSARITGITNGAVAVYTTTNYTVWTHKANLFNQTGVTNFGFSVDMTYNGQLIAVTALPYNGNRNGGVYLFKLDTTVDTWLPVTSLIQWTNVTVPIDQGRCISLSANGNSMVMSAAHYASQTDLDGQVYPFTVSTVTGCQDRVDGCSSNPCQYGSTCADTVGAFTCTCPPLHTGTLCQSCQPGSGLSTICVLCQAGKFSDAVNAAPCTNCPIGSYSATTNSTVCSTCAAGTYSAVTGGSACIQCLANTYSASNASACIPCTSASTSPAGATSCTACNSTLCQNGATCTNTTAGAVCQCAVGYSGIFCQVNIDECTSAPCKNGGTCIDQLNSFFCACASGYSGVTCQTNVNECVSAPCQNGGTCVDQVASYMCTCIPGYSGVHCQTNVNECTSLPCRNGGTCVDQLNSFFCTCPAGYSGLTCQTSTNECTSVPCKNGGTCVDQLNGFFCTCPAGYSGLLCQTDIPECASAPCQNGGTCEELVNSYICVCATGYVGFKCETVGDNCDPNPCGNTGVCANHLNSYTCTCNVTLGYTGQNCTTDINECATNNGGCDPLMTCTNVDGTFDCSDCAAGYSLNDTEHCVDINECATDNGGCDMFANCTNSVGSFACSCVHGFTGNGTHCEDQNECLEFAPCDTLTCCINEPGSYNCTDCPTGFNGTGYDGCIDIDECALNITVCNSTDICINTQGSAVCVSSIIALTYNATNATAPDCTSLTTATIPGVPATTSTTTTVTLSVIAGVIVASMMLSSAALAPGAAGFAVVSGVEFGGGGGLFNGDET